MLYNGVEILMGKPAFLFGERIKDDDEKPQKKVAHRIGYCVNCGWVHSEIRRVRVEEETSRGRIAVIKPLCVKCIREQEHQVICDLCGRTKCDNLYPVSVIRRVIGKGQTCNLFLHLCAECRKIPHEEILKRLNIPENMCDTCKDRFLCFTNKGKPPVPSSLERGILQDEKTQFHKRRRRFLWR